MQQVHNCRIISYDSHHASASAICVLWVISMAESRTERLLDCGYLLWCGSRLLLGATTGNLLVPVVELPQCEGAFSKLICVRTERNAPSSADQYFSIASQNYHYHATHKGVHLALFHLFWDCATETLWPNLYGDTGYQRLKGKHCITHTWIPFWVAS